MTYCTRTSFSHHSCPAHLFEDVPAHALLTNRTCNVFVFFVRRYVDLSDLSQLTDPDKTGPDGQPMNAWESQVRGGTDRTRRDCTAAS